MKNRVWQLCLLCLLAWSSQTARGVAQVIVRVQIANSSSPVVIGTSTPAVITDGRTQTLGQLAAMKPFVASPTGQGIRLNGVASPIVQIKPTQGGMVTINGRWYAGDMMLTGSGSVLAINYVDLEQYVISVVEAEMGASFSPEALKAQAVAARSYVLYHRKVNQWFDVYSDTRSQVYRGAGTRSVPALAATQATTGQVLVYDNAFVNAMYSASNGGRTVGVKGIPYFQTLPDVTNHPRNGHGIGMSQWGAQERARQGWNYLQILAYYYRGVGLGKLPQ